jgi:hypothetical protein
MWAIRNLNNGWTTPPTQLMAGLTAWSYPRITPGRQSRWIVTSVVSPSNIHLFTSGFPPNSIPDGPYRTASNLSIQIYPQPVHDFLRLTLPLEARGLAEVSVYNVLGQRVMLRPLSAGNSALQLAMPVGSAAGTYFLELRTPVHTFHKPFVFVP